MYGRYCPEVDRFCRYGLGLCLKIFFWTGVLFFILLCLMMARGAKSTASGKEKAVIILGAGLHGDEISDTLKRRLDAALSFYEKNRTVVFVVSGGQGPQETRAEADAMADYLTLRGISAERIIKEARSASTRQNFAFSLPLLAERSIRPDDPVCFVTNDFHCLRSAAYAKKAGFQNVSCLSASTSFIVIFPAVMREALAICALWLQTL